LPFRITSLAMEIFFLTRPDAASGGEALPFAKVGRTLIPLTHAALERLCAGHAAAVRPGSDHPRAASGEDRRPD
jgi:hypothetical protein